MSIKIYLQGGLSAVTKGKQTFELDGKTVGECLSKLVSHLPKLKDVLFFEKRDGPALFSHIEVRLNKKAISEIWAKEVNAGDEIHIKKTSR